MTDALHLVAAVSQRLNSFIADQRDSATENGSMATQFVDAAALTLQGGKRLRARFAHTGWQAAGGAALSPAIIGVAAALEVFQAAALVHDDLIDHSDTRRGRPAAHRALEAAHVADGWAGDAADFGVSASILLGDLLVAWSDDLFEESIVDATNAAHARFEYARMRRDVTIGQFLDVAQESAWVTQPDAEHAEQALRVASLKSARYSVEQPLIIGAALAGARQDQLQSLRTIGHGVGIAFQLRDDLLGVFGDEATTGKPAGDDIREGKRTLLVAYTRESLDAAETARFDEALGNHELSDAEVQRLQRTMQDTGAVAKVENAIAANTEAALTELASADLAAEAVADLRELITAAVNRKA